jgi:hypothetical protein
VLDAIPRRSTSSLDTVFNGSPWLGGAILACAIGVLFVTRGTIAVVKRRFEIKRRGVPLDTYEGRHAIRMGVGLLLFGLLVLAFGICDFVRIYHNT